MRLSNRAILLLILLIGAVLRFYRFTDIPFTHDEFSAIFRTNFYSFHELIEKGVKPDGHPAGIQVFLYYWLKLFGSKEWVVKLPFAIMGVGSVWLVYLIAKKWHNETVGLISAAFFATIQYTVMYSQIARPYISGLFFSLTMVYFWTKLMAPHLKHFWRNAIPYIVASTLCAYNHHFSLLFAALAGISGIFFIPRKFLTRYVLCGIFIFILYIPHLGIFMTQLKTGGIGGWLGTPEYSFLPDYLYYLSNYSLATVLLAVGLTVFGLVFRKKGKIRLQNYILFLAWFFIPLLIGFWYSVKINPVLQYSVLIFSFYPLLFLFFGHIPNQKATVNLALVLIILPINIYSLINQRKHYALLYNMSFERIVTDYISTKKSHRKVTSIIHSHKKITRYYLEKHQADSAFRWFDSFANEAELMHFLRESHDTSDFIYLGAFASISPNAVPIIRQYFPVMQIENNYFLGSTYVFSKSGKDERQTITHYGFEAPPPADWRSISKEKIVDTNSCNGSFSYRIDSLTEWSPTFTTLLRPLISHENNYIDVSVNALPQDEVSETLLITTLQSGGEVVHFSGANFKTFINAATDSNKWIHIHHSLKLSDMNLNYDSLTLNAYVWNKGKNNLLLDDFNIEVREGNPVVYGLYEKIPD